MTWQLFWRINAAVLAILIVVVSLTPDTDSLQRPMDWAGWIANFIFGDPDSGDKVAHFGAYSALAFFAALGFGERAFFLVRIFLVIVGFSLLIEIFQAAGGARQGDWLDLMANSLGTVTGIAGAVAARTVFGFLGWGWRFPFGAR